MWKLIFLGLMVWLAIHIIKRAINPSRSYPDQQNTPSGKKDQPEPIENMVQCATCQVHLPRSEAFMVNGNFYCSQAHIEHK